MRSTHMITQADQEKRLIAAAITSAKFAGFCSPEVVLRPGASVQARPEAAIVGAPSDVRGGYGDPSCTMELDLAEVDALTAASTGRCLCK